MKIDLANLQKLCKFFFTKIESELGFKEINININCYWNISFENSYNFNTQSPEICVGSFSDDLEWLTKVLLKKNPSTVIDFERIGNIIKILGDQIYTPYSTQNELISQKIKINNIHLLCKRILEKTQKAGYKNLDILYNFYWYINTNDAYDFTKEPKVIKQSWSDDWQNLKNLLFYNQNLSHENFKQFERAVKVIGETLAKDMKSQQAINWLTLPDE